MRAAARQCELSATTVVKAHQAHRRGGWAAVKVKHGHRPKGSGCLLAPEQAREVQGLIQGRTPEQLKMGYALWSRQAVGELIEARYGIRLKVRNVGKYLKRWGYTPQKLLKKAYEQSPTAVGRWLNEQYPLIAARAKQEGAEIQWGDESGLRSDDVRGRDDAPKGQTPMLRVNACREGLSVISTVTNKGQMRWRVFSGALNAKILIGFLERLTRPPQRKIFLILDNLRGSPLEAGQALARGERRQDRGLLSAQLFSGIECGRIAQRRSQAKSHHGRSGPNRQGSQTNRCARFAEHSKTTATRPELLPA